MTTKKRPARYLNGRFAPVKRALLALKVGENFRVEAEHAAPQRIRVILLGFAKAEGIRIKTQVEEVRKLRVWRVA